MMNRATRLWLYGRAINVRSCLLGSAMLLGVLMLSGCAGQASEPKTIKFAADIVVAEALNPDSSGRPSPLLLAIYQLKSAENFRNKDFFTVFDPQGVNLGSDLLRREELTLQPGESSSFEAVIEASAEYIGVVGAFSDIENSQWRAVIEIPEKGLMDRINVFKGERLRIVVEERSVSIEIGNG